MAQIGNDYNVRFMFPKAYAEYKLELTETERDLLRKYCYDEEFMLSFEENPGVDESDPAGFQVNYTKQNLLQRHPDFASLKKAIDDINEHFCTKVNQCALPPGCTIEICDSWFVRSCGDPNYRGGIMRNEADTGNYSKEHTHSFSLYSGVLYLNEEPSEQGFYFAKDHEFGAFTWDRQTYGPGVEEHNRNCIEIYPEYGRVIMFDSRIKHGLIFSDNPNDIRYSLVWNTWPNGAISNNRSGSLDTNDFPSNVST